MADKKISQLTTLAQADVAVTADFLPIVDTSATETKKATPQALVQAGATGATLPVALGAVGTPSYTFTGDLNTGLWSPAADTLAASTGGSERLRVDSSGNLGLGVTPSAWTSYKSIEIARAGNGIFGWGSGGETGITSNAYYNAGWKYGGTGAAALFSSFQGAFSWNTAASGTAGNAITFTQAMTLDASGNLGIGTASPAYKLDVSGDIHASNEIYLDNGKYLRFKRNSGGLSIDTLGIESGTDNVRLLTTGTLKVVNGALSTLMLLDSSSGNLGIGTTNPSVKLEVNGQIRTEAPTGGTAANWRLGTVHTVSPTSPNRTIEVDIGGTIYYLHAKTTNN